MAMLDGRLFAAMIVSAAHNLENNKQDVNDMNVFPVPDGDTGTNMALTMMAAAEEVMKNPDDDVSVVAKNVASAALRGARGNSGVILSQFLRGFSKGLGGVAKAQASDLAAAYTEAVNVAYRAVMNPTEGTILTVARLAAEKGRQTADMEDVTAFLKGVIDAANEALEQTPKLLPVLEQAGVVDAGGMGLVKLLEGAYHAAVTGVPVALTQQREVRASRPESVDIHATSPFTYCTEFIILKHNPSQKAKRIEGTIKNLGDCVLVIDDNGFAKVHVHTDNPGLVLQEALQIGSLTDIKIDNMKEQSANRTSPLTESGPEEAEDAKEVEISKAFGFVGVCAGEGMSNLLRDAGIDQVIAGGQTMNPSAEDIAGAVRRTGAQNVFVFPNNKNIILAANQAAEILEGQNVFVLPSKNIPQCITAMLAFDADCPADENYDRLFQALDSVKAASVTYSVRDTNINGLEVKKDDVIGITKDGIVCAEETANEAALSVLSRLYEEDDSIISVYYGADITEDMARELSQTLEKTYPDCDIMCYDGGQPVYYYIVSVE